MRNRASKAETFIDSMIPFAIILIILITIIDVFLLKFVKPYYWIIDIIDFCILTVFIIDLGFKFRHAKNVSSFLKRYWIYIIAVFPFFLAIRVLERFYHISALSSDSTIILGRYVATLLNETRIARFAEIFRVLNISSRFLRATYFYENPKVRHRINITRVLKLKGKKRP